MLVFPHCHIDSYSVSLCEVQFSQVIRKIKLYEPIFLRFRKKSYKLGKTADMSRYLNNVNQVTGFDSRHLNFVNLIYQHPLKIHPNKTNKLLHKQRPNYNISKYITKTLKTKANLQNKIQ